MVFWQSPRFHSLEAFTWYGFLHDSRIKDFTPIDTDYYLDQRAKKITGEK